MSLSVENQFEIIESFSSTSRYLDDLLNIDNTYFDGLISQIQPPELYLNAASASYLDCYLYIVNGKLTTRLYDKRDDFNFPIVNFPFLSSNIPSAPAYGVYVSQLIRYARTRSNYQDFMAKGIKKPNW